MRETQKPLKTLKPVFLTAVVLLAHIPLYINATLVGGGVLGAISFLVLLWQGLSYPVWYPFVGFGCLFLLGTPLAVYFIGKRTYDKTDYQFYQHHLAYCEGFWTLEHKSIQYRNITEVYLRQSIVQRLYGVGTLYLSVPAMGGRGFGGVIIADVRYPDQIYQEIQSIILS